jgi:chemotaxis methyl-accepting protein methylase
LQRFSPVGIAATRPPLACFRKVRRQVCKRLKRRIRELGLDDLADYRRRLDADPAEWHAFDECCHITISRFFRDRGVFEVLRKRILPDIAARVVQEKRIARIWSAGCASGEEPYTLKIIWDCEIAPSVPGASVSIVATDIDETVPTRAGRGCFEPTSLRELPPHIVRTAFDSVGSLTVSRRNIETALNLSVRICGAKHRNCSSISSSAAMSRSPFSQNPFNNRCWSG